MTRGAIDELVKAVFEKATERLMQQGEEYHPKAQRLVQAPAHWLRHTAGSHMVNNDMDLHLVRDNLTLESLNSTSGYLHSLDDVHHRAIEEKHKIG